MILEAKAIEKSYGALKVLHGVDFAVEEGETFAIIGPNGAGKTTLFKVLTGESPVNSGEVRFRGQDVTHMPDFRRARLGFGRTFQVARIFPEVDVFTNVAIAVEARKSGAGASAGRWWDWRASPEVADEVGDILERFGFGRARWAGEASFLSHGDRKRLEFCIALATRPAILMLDEPTAGMSPSDRKQMTELLAKLKNESDISIVMTEHDMDIIFELAERLLVLNYGEVLATGDPASVRADKVVREVYLGQHHA